MQHLHIKEMETEQIYLENMECAKCLQREMRPYPNVPIGMRLTDHELHESTGGWADEKTEQLLALKQRGFVWNEIATEMNMSVGGVRKKYYRIRDEEER